MVGHVLRRRKTIAMDTPRLSCLTDYPSGWQVQSGTGTCSEGFVKMFFESSQDVGLYCSCHAAHASMDNF